MVYNQEQYFLNKDSFKGLYIPVANPSNMDATSGTLRHDNSEKVYSGNYTTKTLYVCFFRFLFKKLTRFGLGYPFSKIQLG